MRLPWKKKPNPRRREAELGMIQRNKAPCRLSCLPEPFGEGYAYCIWPDCGNDEPLTSPVNSVTITP